MWTRDQVIAGSGSVPRGFLSNRFLYLSRDTLHLLLMLSPGRLDIIKSYLKTARPVSARPTDDPHII